MTQENATTYLAFCRSYRGALMAELMELAGEVSTEDLLTMRLAAEHYAKKNRGSADFRFVPADSNGENKKPPGGTVGDSIPPGALNSCDRF